MRRSFLLLAFLSLVFGLREVKATECPSGYYQCDGGLCIPSTFVCDGIPDCIAGDDEKNCLQKEKTKSQCPSDYYQCDGGLCIPASFVCDTIPDCITGDDETNCPREDNLCCEKNGLCLAGWKVCDTNV
ncbi:low-density lipoprotein receptor class A domain-containing protein 3-like [Palaemon carinicauda]|uniref:low-density lipoprotein receptor class A domain-containing protein 3-like n=1 Tax=Palaemon carinicauda TaxID=392227 RepID=UPI0035B6A556